MTKTEPLAQLKDIHLPAPVGWWPPAPGWYFVLALIVFFISFISYRAYKHYGYALAKKQALILLDRYQEHYERDHNVPLTSAHISELLRRVALVYFPRTQVASLHGEAWLQFLNQTSKGIDFNSVRTLLLDAPFKKGNTQDLGPLFSKAKLWIKQRKRPCSN